MRNKIYFIIFLSFIFFVLDRLIKKIILFRGGFLFFKLIKNPYFIFLFRGKIFYFFILIILLIIIFFIIRSYQIKNFSNFFLLSLIFAGGFSNFLDRLFYGFVLDYFEFFSLFTFNLADVMILFGSIFFLWQLFKIKK